MGNVKTGCLEWQGAVNHGYGMVRHGTQSPQRAHRVSYIWSKGEIPKGFVIDHLCRNKLCVRSDHLEAVTQDENIRRSQHCATCRCNGGIPL